MGVKEIQAIIMAGGKGSRMTELTTKRPKCLLPVGNLPLIWYPIRLLEKSGFKEVCVVVLESIKGEVQAALEHTTLGLQIEIISIPNGEDWGTADSLRYLEENNKITSDVLVVSCDLLTDLDLSGLLNVFRQHDASLATLFFQPTAAKVSLPTPGPKTKDKTERDLVGIDADTSRLVFLASASDYEDSLALSRGLLRKHGRIKLYSHLLDAHVYVMKRWLCQYLLHNRGVSVIKGELIPHTVKKQFTRPSSTKPDPDKLSTELIDLAEETVLTTKVKAMSNFTDHGGDMSAAYHGDLIRCYAHIAPDTSFATRANTLQEYCRINREIVSRWQEVGGSSPMVSVVHSAVVESSQLERESCLVGDRATVSDRTAVRGSVLGPDTCVKPRTRVFNCVLMAGAQVGEGCALVNCVLCDGAVVEDNCDLKDCLVGSHHTVAAGEKHLSEVLTDDDHLLEIV